MIFKMGVLPLDCKGKAGCLHVSITTVPYSDQLEISWASLDG